MTAKPLTNHLQDLERAIAQLSVKEKLWLLERIARQLRESDETEFPETSQPEPEIQRPAVYAHRGASKEARENTIAAFERAIELGAEGIELDVRCTIDRVAVVYHDAEIQERAIEQLTWAEVQSLDAEIPTLTQAVQYCKDRILLDVEIKESGYEAEVLEALKPLTIDRFVITSFKLDALDRVKQLNSQIKVGFLIDVESIAFLPNARTLNQRLKAIGVDFFALDWLILNHPAIGQLSPQVFWIWTVNQPVITQKLIDEANKPDNLRQIAALITDYPDRALALRKGTVE
ncbi:glycerophosphodiester phosphodiesterase [Leptolyngbya ohadii]|uniref:glycerophosphodiester phosphodiesterase n=1 Tax=Leptolyngbya ohadii TaxID=1962290 RepID=UPI000B59AFF3|nr:glycerophosphodiester phosphodiesterase [Leptolyngbya ohadii]